MRAGKHALRAIALSDRPLLGANGERARCCKSRQRDVPRLPWRPGFACAGADGEMRPLFVPADQFANSVHGDAGLRCVDCHTTITELPHKTVPGTLADQDRARLAINKNCVNCHAKAAQGYLETYHGQVAALGYANVATCSDCHGTHAILPRQQSRHRAWRRATC